MLVNEPVISKNLEPHCEQNLTALPRKTEEETDRGPYLLARLKLWLGGAVLVHNPTSALPFRGTSSVEHKGLLHANHLLLLLAVTHEHDGVSHLYDLSGLAKYQSSQATTC